MKIKGYIIPPSLYQHSWYLKKTQDSFGRAISEEMAQKLLLKKEYILVEREYM